MKHEPLLLAALLLAGCYGSIPPEPPCGESPSPDGVVTRIRIKRDMSRRPREVWHVRQDSSGSWVRHGRDIHYFLTGQPAAIEWYRNGRLNGKANYWHENGSMQGEIVYKDGLADGLARTWYDDGQLESERPWKDGKLVGFERTYDRRGKLVREKSWPAKTDTGPAQ
jgi:MORN repeat variant